MHSQRVAYASILITSKQSNFQYCHLLYLLLSKMYYVKQIMRV